MKQDQISVIEDSARRSVGGEIHFGEVVQMLAAVGVERYHADYTRSECTYYLPDGDSFALTLDLASTPIATTFCGSEIEASIRRAQQGEIRYRTFVEQTTAAGCVGYFVQITGRQVIYFGRGGEMHIEPFPSAPRR